MLFRDQIRLALVWPMACVSLLTVNIILSASQPTVGLDPSDVAWQEIAPEGEEFSVLMPFVPRVSQGRRYFYLNRHVLVNFAVYSLVHDNTLFVIQSYESAKPKDLIKDLFSSRTKGLRFQGDFQSNGYKGKTFTQQGDAFVDRGRYLIAKSHLYIIEAARRDSADSAMDRFLNSFAIRTATKSAPLSNATMSQSEADLEYSGKELTRKVIILSKGEPTYTPEARDSHITGSVSLRARFSASGLVEDVVVLSGLPKGLTEQAIEASKTIVFIPADKNGKPVSQVLELTYSFMLSP